MTTVIALGWVPINRYCELFGETPDAVDKRLRSGHWLRDVHVRHPVGSKQSWINIQAVNDWAAGRVTAPPKRGRG
ncbi:excisionase [Variovorax sp. KBW07]|uniref:excisionase n=1 Tax=Variovorax sp. KBW07 TaxID=2153358 RepID=UPI000F585685|nr:excisionase [Variovorax sp. KBW07]